MNHTPLRVSALTAVCSFPLSAVTSSKPQYEDSLDTLRLVLIFPIDNSLATGVAQCFARHPAARTPCADLPCDVVVTLGAIENAPRHRHCCTSRRLNESSNSPANEQLIS